MHTVAYHPNAKISTVNHHYGTVITRFLGWTKNEEKNRIAWVGISITMMTAICFPLTMASILIHGASFGLIVGAMFSLVLVVIPNLAALPTRFTLPAFITGILIDVVLISLSFVI